MYSNDDPIFPEDMEKLENVRRLPVALVSRILTGLETATGLTELMLSNNAIVDLEPLEDLTSLTDLNLSGNQIMDVSPSGSVDKSANVELVAIIRLTDVAPLAGLTDESDICCNLTGNPGIIRISGALYHLAQQVATRITGVNSSRCRDNHG